MNLVKNEPVVTAALAVIAALIVLLVAFGVHLTQEQQAAIGGLAAAILALAGLVRSAVTPTAKVKKNG
jgi:uncharacterized membrane protein